MNEVSGLARFIPIFGWLPKYQRSWLRVDLLAGLIAAAVVIPQAMAYASIAGLPVQVGLYVCLVPMVVYAILGTSRPLSVSSTSTISMLVAAQLVKVVSSSDPNVYIIPAATLAFLVGVFLVLAGLLRLGFLANFISLPVLTGFKAGIGVVIFVGQLGKVLGIKVDKGPVFETIFKLIANLGQTHLPTLVLALITLAVLILLPRIAPKIPAALVAVVGGILASGLLGLEAQGVSLVGDIPAGLPKLSIPDWSLIQSLWMGALGIALISFVESIASARAFMHHGDPQPDANQELFALGMANLAGAFTSAYPAGGGTSQTAVNDQAGAKSQIAELATAGVVVVTLLFLAPLISLMPQATLGALILVAAVGLVKVSEFQKILRLRNIEFAWAVITALGVIFLGALEGIAIAVIFSLLHLIYLTNHPPVYRLGRKSGTDFFRSLNEHPQDEVLPGLLMLRMEGVLYFGSSPRAIEKFWAVVREEKVSVLVLDCSAIPGIEYTALAALTEFEEKLSDQGVALWLAALTPDSLHLIERAELGRKLTHARLFFDLAQAYHTYEKKYMTNSQQMLSVFP
jgi:high affinity sulfate transporter 1